MRHFLQTRYEKLRAKASSRILDFQPYIKPLTFAGCPIRFFYATAQAASWYDPLSDKDRRELEWLIANLGLEGQRIIDQDLWDQVKARQGTLQGARSRGSGPGYWDRRRPRYLLTGLMRCGVCGGGVATWNRVRIGA